jgi:transmembrane sensor
MTGSGEREGSASGTGAGESGARGSATAERGGSESVGTFAGASGNDTRGSEAPSRSGGGPRSTGASGGAASDAEGLMAEADEARRAGRPERAAELLERASRLSGDPAAGVAAFTLGRLELEALGRPARAAAAFSRALDATLPARLREDAAARLVEAHVRSGDASAARRAADAYLRDYPNGRHVERVRPHAGP